MPEDYTALIEELSREFRARNPRSAALDERARAVMVDGGNHGVRLSHPFPPRIASARGGRVTDVDGHSILDFWQGHFANILGNSPDVVAAALSGAVAGGDTLLQLGIPDELTVETAELLCPRLHTEKLRFTTSGTLATMYAIMLARAYTGRELVLKVGGGWQGSQPWGLVGYALHPGPEPWTLDSEGLPSSVEGEVEISRFNDPEDLAARFRDHGDRIACMIVEPVVGAGEFMFGRPEYLGLARELTERYGALLIFDEVVCGFRFRAGDVGSMYGLQPDLITVGKVIGGGMPVAAFGGRADVLDLCGRGGGNRVGASGGTYSAHPASLLAARTMVSHLIEHEDEVYPRLAVLGERLRHAIEDGFAAGGIPAYSSGAPLAGIPGSSLTAVHFVLDEEAEPESPHESNDPSCCDVALKDGVLQLALLLEGVYTLFGCFAVGTAHTEDDIDRVRDACEAVARRVAAHRRTGGPRVAVPGGPSDPAPSAGGDTSQTG